LKYQTCSFVENTRNSARLAGFASTAAAAAAEEEEEEEEEVFSQAPSPTLTAVFPLVL